MLIWGDGDFTSSGRECKLEDILKMHVKALRKVAASGASRGFPGGAVVENLPANAGDTGSSPGLGRSHMPRSI